MGRKIGLPALQEKEVHISIFDVSQTRKRNPGPENRAPADLARSRFG